MISREQVVKEMQRRKSMMDERHKTNPSIAQQRFKNLKIS